MDGMLLVIIAYLLGSLTFGEIIARLKGVNLREIGSGNIGATNVSRALGKKYGILVFILDMLKGFIPTLLAIKIHGLDSWITFFVGIASVVGHMYPLFFKFRGGKGVATAFGVLLAVSVNAAFLSFLTWLLVVYETRYVSLGSIIASFISVPLLVIFEYPLKLIFMALIISLLVLYKHKDNIGRLLIGREHKI
ncbi:MAG TPA: glycerol-3-phosphate 1-O-acyltransferase PlsY [Aquificaceae bacterium]|nr:glycerol-3-phosphate 1-O-acyltransferase PlsY [Aquificaceae bacterium]HIQ48572.1 glycerol-3-phosphate 1-O-acyltransferase [Aquifex aeolicus]